MDHSMLLILGLLLTAIGIVNIRGNIRTIHSYNRRNVREADVPKYGKAVGSGTLVPGLAMLVAFPVSFLSETAVAWILLPAIVVGLALILHGQFKYNKGLF